MILITRFGYSSPLAAPATHMAIAIAPMRRKAVVSPATECKHCRCIGRFPLRHLQRCRLCAGIVKCEPVSGNSRLAIEPAEAFMLRKAPKQARSEEMVSCILAGATRILRSTRLADATTNRIAEVAGVSVGSVYQYFGSKQSIAT